MQRRQMKVTDFTVELVQRNAVVNFIEKHHYSHNVNGVQSLYHYGLYREGNFGLPTMIGAMMYAYPSMPATAAKYNPINPGKCLELRRLVCIDDTPKNTESYFVLPIPIYLLKIYRLLSSQMPYHITRNLHSQQETLLGITIYLEMTMLLTLMQKMEQ